MTQTVNQYYFLAMDFLPDSIAAVQQTPKPWNGGRKLGGMNPKTVEAIELVVEHGIDPMKALMIARNGESVSLRTVARLKEKVARWSIERPAAQKIAHSTLLKFAAGLPVNGVQPKATDIRASAERVVDAMTPVTRRTENLNLNADYCPVDLESRYGIR